MKPLLITAQMNEAGKNGQSWCGEQEDPYQGPRFSMHLESDEQKETALSHFPSLATLIMHKRELCIKRKSIERK